MTHSDGISLDDWIAREAIPFTLGAPDSVAAAVDALVATLGDEIELLGFGEPLHGGLDILRLRNGIFQRLVESHGYRSIALESSFPRGRLVDRFIAGSDGESGDDIWESGFSHGFGALEENRALVRWMQAHNADTANGPRLHFYGFDSPTEMMYGDSPRQILTTALTYLEAIDPERARAHRERMEPLLGDDTDWENPAVAMDPSQGIGLSPSAVALRLATEELMTELRRRRPELVAASGPARYHEAVRHTALARQLLTYHAEMAGTSKTRISDLLGLRDLMMADNLEHIVARERDRGKVLVFAHNTHLQRGMAGWQLGAESCRWWPAGAQLSIALGRRYAVVGCGIAASEEHGVARPEPGTLEARLSAAPGPARFVPTHQGKGLRAPEIEALPTRSASPVNPTYFALTPRSLTEFDALAHLDSAA